MFRYHKICYLTKISKNIIKTNLEGQRKVAHGNDVDEIEVRAFIGLLNLARVYRSRGEATRSLWADETGMAIFRATMSEKRFSLLTCITRFDDHPTQPRWRPDKLAPISGIQPGGGTSSFRQCMPSKPAKYGLKVWVLCDVATSYAYNM